MEHENTKRRLSSLDGIRGLAILAVVLNHIDPKYAQFLIPSFLSPFSGVFFASGVIGVSFLFVLSGFFMAYIYSSPVSPLSFLQKRYTRIFPLFLVMTIVMAAYRIYPDNISIYGIPLILLIAFVVNFIWKNFIKKSSQSIGRSLFLFFILVQVLVGGFYALWIMRHPAEMFNVQYPFLVREVFIWLSNLTLSLPLGNYIPMLDGVYWSLAAEVLFYVLYPIFFVPVIRSYISEKRFLKYTLVLSLIPFLLGLNIVAQHISGLSLLQLPIFYCFVTGMSLGIIYKRNPEKILRLSAPFIHKGLSLVPIILVFLTVYVLQTALSFFGPSFDGFIHILSAIPIALLVALSLNENTLFFKFLSSKALVFLGTISYSIYLSHSIVIHMVSNLFNPNSILGSLAYVGLVFFIVIILSKLLFTLLEKPYFQKSQSKSVKSEIVSPMRGKSYISLLLICGIYIIATLSVYQSNFNIFSIDRPVSVQFITPIKISKEEISLRDNNATLLEFQAKDDDMGIVAMHITAVSSRNSKINNELEFKIREKGEKEWYSSTSYLINTIGDSNSHPFGFPTIVDAKGKTYVVSLSLKDTKSKEYIFLHTDKNSIRTVSLLNKGELIKNPSLFISFIHTKINNIFSNKNTIYSFALLTPLLICSIYSLLKERH